MEPAPRFGRPAWLILAGLCAGAGIWATHFVAMLAYDGGLPVAYDPGITLGSLFIAIGMTTLGFWIAACRGGWRAPAGGMVIGAGIGAMHFTGMSAIIVAGGLVWDWSLVAAAVVTAIALSTAATVAKQRLPHQYAVWAAPGLLTLAICGLHFTSMGAVALYADPTMAVRASAMDNGAMAMAVAGVTILVVVLAGLTVEFFSGRNRHEIEAELRRQHESLQEREEELHLQVSRFDMALTSMPHGLCMVDGQRRLLVCNRRYSEMYSLPPELVRPGTLMRDVIDHRIANGIYAGADVAAYRMERLGKVDRPTVKTQALSDGRVIQITRRPTADSGWIAIHEDITERAVLDSRVAVQNALLAQREEELRAQNAKLDAALANMTQGLAMFDADERLVLANDRYAQLYGIEPSLLAPGVTLRELVQQRIDRGLYPGLGPDDVLKMMRERIARGKSNHMVSRPGDGSILSVSIQPRTEGGWVVTLHDISERERLNAQLEHQNQLLKEHERTLEARHVQLDAALNNMVQGLAMFDADQRLVICNRRYAEIYGFTSEQLKSGTTLRELIEHRVRNGLLSDRSADDIVRSMLLSRQGGKSGLSYTHLSDGRWLALTVQPMADGGTVTTHHDITEQRRSEAQIAHMALHDALTGLANRAQLSERLDLALQLSQQTDEIVATHLLDLDHFKNVNDTLGHPVGDKLLMAAAGRLRALVADTDTIARMGGDEFAVVQTGISQPNEASALAQAIIDTVSEPYNIDGQHVIIGASVGIAVAPTDGLKADQLIRNADLALYRAKGDGRGAFRFFEPQMDAAMQQRHTLEYDLRKALTAGEFELHYQPVVSLVRNQISGVEALIRWRHPTEGMVSPTVFIPLAEEIGTIVQIGEWAIREACATAAQWPEDLKVAVNLSAVQFRNPGLVQVVVGALAASGLAAGRLELEITESILLQDSESTLATLYQLRELGVRIAMDDFGTGYSSLSYLQRFPFDKIKIDRSFIRNIAESSGSLNIVRAVTAMANGLGMTTTAEGVETNDQLEAIKAEGCTEMQGFLFSKPRPAYELEQLLQQQAAATGKAVAAA